MLSMRNVVGLALALLMASTGVTLLMFGDSGAGMFVIVLAAACAYLAARKEISLRATLRSTNRSHGTAFNRSTGFGRGRHFFFDLQQEKILITDGKTSRVLDISALQDCTLKWRTRISYRAQDSVCDQVSLIIYMADPADSPLVFELASKDEGDRWHAQIKSLLHSIRTASAAPEFARA